MIMLIHAHDKYMQYRNVYIVNELWTCLYIKFYVYINLIAVTPQILSQYWYV